MVATSLLLAGCTSAPQPTPPPTTHQTTTTPAETKAKLLDLYSDTTALIGGTWTVDTGFWEDCVLADGSEGTEYERLVSSGGVADPEAVAGKVRRLWISRGYAGTTVSKDAIGASIVNSPKNDDRAYARLTINAKAASLEGSGGCAAAPAKR